MNRTPLLIRSSVLNQTPLLNRTLLLNRTYMPNVINQFFGKSEKSFFEYSQERHPSVIAENGLKILEIIEHKSVSIFLPPYYMYKSITIFDSVLYAYKSLRGALYAFNNDVFYYLYAL